MKESNKKVESLVLAFQNLSKETRKENNEPTPPPLEENDKEMREMEDGKGKKNGEKLSPS